MRPLQTLGLSSAAMAIAMGWAIQGYAAESDVLPLMVVRSAGAEDCLSAEALADATNQRLGRMRLAAAVAASAQGYAVTIKRVERGYEAKLYGIGSTLGSRELFDEAKSCAAMSEALVVTLAILVDQQPVAAPMVVAPQAGMRKTAAKPKTAQAGPELPGVAIADERIVGGAALTFGLPTQTTPALYLELVFPWKRWTASVGALWGFYHTSQVGSGEVSAAVRTAYLRGCYAPWNHRLLRVEGCALPMLGASMAEGRGYSPNRRPERLWGAAAGGVVLSGPITGRLGWDARAIAIVPFRSQRFSVDGAGSAYEPSPTAIWLGVAFSGSIW